ncbi:MAG: hypothetical protein HJJLKODD_01817 [Phycisphaerae bacterium]|nr:hypothetical protein [Phycisphaerae bacterium]
MSRKSSKYSLRDALAGKWQIPLMVAGLALLSGALIKMMTREVPIKLTLEERLEQVALLKTGLLLPEAEATVRIFLQDENLTAEEKGRLLAELGEILYQQADNRPERSPRESLGIQMAYARAETLGYPLTGDDLARIGRSYEWQGMVQSALEQYALALQHSQNLSDPLEIRRRVISLRMNDAEFTSEEKAEQLAQLIDDSSERLDILRWALEQQIELLVNDNRLSEAEALLQAQMPKLAGSIYEDAVQYLHARLMYHSGRMDEAELVLRDLSSRLFEGDELQAPTGWLLGQILLKGPGGGRPLTAITFFENVLRANSEGEYVTACRLGMAEALTDLQRYDEAKLYYQQTLQDLEEQPTYRIVSRDRVRESLTLRSRLVQELGFAEVSLDYFQLAADLVSASEEARRVFYLQTLGEMKSALAGRYRQEELGTLAVNPLRAADLRQRSRKLYLSAAGDFQELSDLSIFDELQSAEALWEAANRYDLAGRRSETIRLLESFLEERPDNSRIPQVLYQLGQAYQADGQMAKAVELYQRCIREYERTEAAARSIIPLANCYMRMGPEKSKDAEDVLLYVLEEDPSRKGLYTPKSAIYRDALFSISELYSREGRYEETIERLDEALQRYADDPRTRRATFLLADAYRHSGLDLRDSTATPGSGLRREEVRDKLRDRLSKAEVLFGRVISAAGPATGAELGRVDALQLSLSYIYRADCAYELGEYERALNLYQEVARVYPDSPVALSAYVQMISCLEVLGRQAEVGPKLRQALFLVDKIPAEAFEEQWVRGKPAEWKKYFNWLAEMGNY